MYKNYELLKNLIREQLEDVFNNDISNIKILQTTEFDKNEILDVLSEEFNFITRDEVAYEIRDVDYSISLKAVDINNKIVGVLLFEKTDINDFAKQIEKIIKLNYDLEQLKNKKGITGTAFVIDKKYRGTNLNMLFIRNAMPIISKYDYVLSEVLEHLKTHNYWKRMGFKELGIFNMSGSDEISYLYIAKI